MPEGLELIVDVPTKAKAEEIMSDYQTEGWTAVMQEQDSGKFAVAAAKSPPLPHTP